MLAVVFSATEELEHAPAIVLVDVETFAYATGRHHPVFGVGLFGWGFSAWILRVCRQIVGFE